MVMPQALAQITFPVQLQWSPSHLEEAHWLQYVCQLLEMSLTRLMRFEQSKVSCCESISVMYLYIHEFPSAFPVSVVLAVSKARIGCWYIQS